MQQKLEHPLISLRGGKQLIVDYRWHFQAS